jgi:hypothetical protein
MDEQTKTENEIETRGTGMTEKEGVKIPARVIEEGAPSIALHYFSPDGNYGSAYGLAVMETSHWNQDDWSIVDAVSDDERPAVARLLTESYEPNADQDFIKNQLVEKYGLDLAPYGG